MKYSFKKAERLCHKKAIEMLFNTGHSFSYYPFRILWMTDSFESRYPARVLITVSKKNFRKASERNRVKRLVREAYRHAKPGLYEFLTNHQKQCSLAILYTGKEELPMDTLHSKLKGAILRLLDEQRDS